MPRHKYEIKDLIPNLHRDPAPGRRPKPTASRKERVEQMIKETDTWLRRFTEVWFVRDGERLEDPRGPQPELSDLYDAALDKMAWVEVAAKHAQNVLEQAEANATGTRTKVVKKSAAAKRTKKAKARRG